MLQVATQVDALKTQLIQIRLLDLDTGAQLRTAQVDVCAAEKTVEAIEFALLDARFELVRIGGRQ
jgi:hypothetical protein